MRKERISGAILILLSGVLLTIQDPSAASGGSLSRPIRRRRRPSGAAAEAG